MVQRHIWCLYLLRMFERASEYGRAYQFCQASLLSCSNKDPDSLTAYRSTNLDSWQINQLRTMKVGGNASASDFFTKHGGSSLLANSDTRKKYSSRAAELYKEALAKRVKEDIARQAHLSCHRRDLTSVPQVPHPYLCRRHAGYYIVCWQ